MRQRSTLSIAPRLLIMLGIMLLGLVIRLPALTAPPTVDDWDHYAMQQRIYPVRLSALDMFNFVPNDDAARGALLETGRLPWFASRNLHLSVLRPLSSALVYMDYAWLGGPHHVWRLHAHSLWWWLCLLAGAAALLCATLPFPAAAIALFIYTIDYSHTWPAVWIANRGQLVAISFVFWAVWANIQAQRGRSGMRTVAIVLGVLGILSGEHALPALAYLVAFECFGPDRNLRTGWLGAWPWVLLGVCYVAVHVALGYGASGSSFYVSPFADPLRYLASCNVRLPKLLAELSVGIPAEWWILWPAWQVVVYCMKLLAAWGLALGFDQLQWMAGVAAGLGACVWLSSRRARASSDAREVRWLLAGAMLALAPLTATETMTRLNIAPALGFSALFGWSIWKLAQVVLGRVGSTLRTRIAAALVSAAILYIHVGYAGYHSYVDGKGLSTGVEPSELVRHLQSFDVPKIAERNIFVVHSPNMLVQNSLMYMLHFGGRPRPHSIEILTPAPGNAHVIERVAPNVMDIRFPDPLVGVPFRHTLYRSEDQPFEVGQILEGKRFRVGVLAVSNGEPTHLRFEFPTPLDDPRYLFMLSKHGILGPVPFELPRVGESAIVPAVLPW